MDRTLPARRKPDGQGVATVAAVIGCELNFLWQEQVVISAATTYAIGGLLRHVSYS